MAFSHNTIKSIKSKLVYVENTIDNADDAESDDDVMKKELDVDGFFDGFSQISFNRYFESSQIWKIMRVDYFSFIQKINVPPPRNIVFRD